MKKTIKLTESDLMRLVKRVIKERIEKSLVDEYINMMDQIVNEYSDEDDGEYMIDDLASLVNSAENDEELSDDDIDEIYNYYDSIIDNM
jgi:hypothetical protein